MTKKVSKKLLKKSIDTLNIGPTIIKRLHANNVNNVADLCALDLESCGYIGRPAFYKIKDCIEALGLNINTDYLNKKEKQNLDDNEVDNEAIEEMRNETRATLGSISFIHRLMLVGEIMNTLVEDYTKGKF